MPQSDSFIRHLKYELWLIWDSRHMSPRGHNTLLTVCAILRVLACCGIALRLAMNGEELTESAYLVNFIFTATLVGYSSLTFLMRIFFKDFFFSKESKTLQIILDLAFYTTAHVISQSIKSDIYYLNILPFLIAAEFFPLTEATFVLVSVVAIHILVFLIFVDSIDPIQWLLRDLGPRTFIISIIGAVYLAHRQLRAPTDATLAEKRSQLIALGRKITRHAPGKKHQIIHELERGLQEYTENVDWFRRMLTKDGDTAHGNFGNSLFNVLRITEEAKSEKSEKYQQTIEQVIQQLASALECCAATFRVLGVSPTGKRCLILRSGVGCASKRFTYFKHVELTQKSIVVDAFTSGKVRVWTAQYGINAKDVLCNKEFAIDCNIQSIISIPILFDGQNAVATFYRNSPREFTPAERAFLEAVMDYLISIINNSRYHRKLVERLNLVRKIASEIPSIREESGILRYLVQKVKNEFDCEIATVFLMRGEQLKRKADAGIEQEWFSEEGYKIGESITGASFLSNEPYMLRNDAPASSISRHNLERYSQKLKTKQVQHILAIPLRGQHSNIGVLRLINKLNSDGNILPDGFASDEAEILVAIGSIIALSIETTRQFAQFNVIFNLKNATDGSPSQKEVSNAICISACAAVNADQTNIILFNEDDFGLVESQVRKVPLPKQPAKYQVVHAEKYRVIDLQNYPAVDIIKKSFKSLSIHDAQNDGRASAVVERLKMNNIASVLLVPLVVDHRIIGLLSIDSVGQKREFLPEEIALCELIAAYGAKAIEQAQRREHADTEIRSAERDKIRKDLHDIKALFGSNIMVDLQLMADMLDDKKQRSNLGNALANTLNKAKFIQDNILYIMDDLHHPVLYEEGLAPAIDQYINQHWADKCAINFRTTLTRRLDFEIEHEIYRIAQEAIANACRHGIQHVTNGCIAVNLVDHCDTVELSICDNGRGFNLGQVKRESLGIGIMKHRAETLKTHLLIDSSPGVGTCVKITVDLTIPYGVEE